MLPEMTLPEAIDTTRIPRVAGLTGDRTACVTTHPFRAPHHTISNVGLIGGGQVPMAYHGPVSCVPECRNGLSPGLLPHRSAPESAVQPP